MAESDEPLVKKKRGMGAGTPPTTAPLADLPSHAGSAGGATPVADASATVASAVDAPPMPASAGAEAASEEDIQAVLAQVDAGSDWEAAARKKPGRPPRQPVMPPGSLDKFVKLGLESKLLAFPLRGVDGFHTLVGSPGRSVACASRVRVILLVHGSWRHRPATESFGEDLSEELELLVGDCRPGFPEGSSSETVFCSDAVARPGNKCQSALPK
eukprot:2914194-Amphidinium_carterae.1